MHSNSIHWIEDLSPSDTLVLTELLRLPENSQIIEYWLTEQEKKIECLPTHLKRSWAFIPRFLERFINTKAVLCSNHKQLDSQLIRRLFIAIVDECTFRVRHFTDSPPADDDIKQWWVRVQSINSLWTQPILYRYLFNATPSDLAFGYIHSECEACILATIGGNTRILSDLRISAITRRRHQGPIPRIIRILDGWLYWTGISDSIKIDSKPLYLKVRNARRERQRQRRYGSKALSETIRTDERNQSVPDATETEIVDFYLNRLSRVSHAAQLTVRPNNDGTASLHPAFRESIVFDASAEEYAQRQEDGIPPVPKLPSVVQAPKQQLQTGSSVYSHYDSGVGSSANARKTTEWRPNDCAEQRSKAYCKLVGISDTPKGDKDESQPLNNTDHRSFKRVKRRHDLNDAQRYDATAGDRAVAYRRLVGKTEKEYSIEGQRLIVDGRWTPPKNWEEFRRAHHALGHLLNSNACCVVENLAN